MNIEQLYDVLHHKNKELFIEILSTFKRKVTFCEISKLLRCDINTLYALNRTYECNEFFKWNRSYYEELINLYLQTFNIKFEREKTFDGLVGIKR
jgi:hypothetical protein